MTEQIHYRCPKALRLHTEQLEKRCRQDAQRDAAERRGEAVTSAIKAQQR